MDACHIKVCILSGDLHIFVYVFYVDEKFFSSKHGSFLISR